MKTRILTLSLVLTALAAEAKVALPAMVGDNMVLQQNTEVTLWGKSDPGKTVKVTPSWSGVTYTATAGNDGRWSVDVATPAASYTPYTITFDDGDATTVGNVLIGEVWLASGQSNMQMPLKGFDGCPTKGGFEEIATARDRADRIRFINIPLTQSYTPLDDTEAAWSVPSPDTAPDYSATAWYYACRLNDVLDVPVGIVNAAYGGARVESWTPREILETYADVSLDPADIEAMTHYMRPMLMYNAMFVPVKDYTYKGIIWYQGCSNVGHHADYPQRLATMVQHWRDEIGQGDIPFYQVEIAPYLYDSKNETLGGPLLRESQWKAAEIIPNCGIICNNDLVEPYEPYNIHPANKQAVGRRLGNLALNRTYGKKQFPADHITYRSCEPKDGKMHVTFNVPQGGVCRNYDIQGFELAGADRKFYPADKVDFNWRDNSLTISSEAVSEPVAVRYCFRDWQPGTFYGANYMPLVPFRSDDWE